MQSIKIFRFKCCGVVRLTGRWLHHYILPLWLCRKQNISVIHKKNYNRVDNTISLSNNEFDFVPYSPLQSPKDPSIPPTPLRAMRYEFPNALVAILTHILKSYFCRHAYDNTVLNPTPRLWNCSCIAFVESTQNNYPCLFLCISSLVGIPYIRCGNDISKTLRNLMWFQVR